MDQKQSYHPKRLAGASEEMMRRLLIVLVLVPVITLSTFAWFVINKMTRTRDLEVIMPPIIYIKDDNLREMVSFDLDGLQINETYYALFCVAPAYKGVVEDYDVGIIYTENIGMIIDLFPVENITDTAQPGKENQQRLLQGQQCFFNYVENTDTAANKPTDVYYSNEKRGSTYIPENLNRGVHKMYSGKFEPQKDKYTGDVLTQLNDTESYRFYVLRVTWKENITEAELEKETDVVYIVTKGGTGGSEQTQ